MEGAPVGQVPYCVRHPFKNRPIALAGRQREAPEPWFTDLKLFRRVFLRAGDRADETQGPGQEEMAAWIERQKTALTTKRYYRVGELSVRFDVSPQTVYRMIDLGELKAVRLRGCLRVSAEELRRYEKRRRADS